LRFSHGILFDIGGIGAQIAPAFHIFADRPSGNHEPGPVAAGADRSGAAEEPDGDDIASDDPPGLLGGVDSIFHKRGGFMSKGRFASGKFRHTAPPFSFYSRDTIDEKAEKHCRKRRKEQKRAITSSTRLKETAVGWA